MTTTTILKVLAGIWLACTIALITVAHAEVRHCKVEYREGGRQVLICEHVRGRRHD